MNVIAWQASLNVVSPRTVVTINPTLTVALAAFQVVPGLSYLTGEVINDDVTQSANLQIEESWSASGPWSIALFNELQNIAAGESRTFYLSLLGRGPYMRVTGTASGAGLSARLSFATTGVEYRPFGG